MVKALAFEIGRLGMGAVDSDFTMKNDYAHPTSQKRGDIAVTSDGHLELTHTVDRHQHTDFIVGPSQRSGPGAWHVRVVGGAGRLVGVKADIPVTTRGERNSRSKAH